MAESIQAASPSLPPHVQLIQMGTGGAVAHVVQLAAKLGLADLLADGPRSAVELAGPLVLHAPSLHRLMRTMASLELLTEGEAQRFSLTKIGEALKTGAPGSARATLLMTGSSWVGTGFANILHSVQTGRTGFEKAQGMPSSTTLLNIPKTLQYLVKQWSGFMVPNPQRSQQRTIFRRSELSSMSEGRPAICSQLSLSDTQDLVACCSIGRMWWSTRPSCSKPMVLWIV